MDILLLIILIVIILLNSWLILLFIWYNYERIIYYCKCKCFCNKKYVEINDIA